jgi:hypothetical protein
MSKTISKDELLALTKKEIRVVFETKIAAAEYFGITTQQLRLVLKGYSLHMPDYILAFMGYKPVTIYEKDRENEA